MKLFEHPDFEQAIIRAAEHFRSQGLREAIIEKDYYVTEALRIIEREAGGKVIFTGLHSEESNIQANYIIRNEINIQGSFAYTPRPDDSCKPIIDVEAFK